MKANRAPTARPADQRQGPPGRHVPAGRAPRAERCLLQPGSIPDRLLDAGSRRRARRGRLWPHEAARRADRPVARAAYRCPIATPRSPHDHRRFIKPRHDASARGRREMPICRQACRGIVASNDGSRRRPKASASRRSHVLAAEITLSSANRRPGGGIAGGRRQTTPTTTQRLGSEEQHDHPYHAAGRSVLPSSWCSPEGKPMPGRR